MMFRKELLIIKRNPIKNEQTSIFFSEEMLLMRMKHWSLTMYEIIVNFLTFTLNFWHRKSFRQSATLSFLSALETSWLLCATTFFAVFCQLDIFIFSRKHYIVLNYHVRSYKYMSKCLYPNKMRFHSFRKANLS